MIHIVIEESRDKIRHEYWENLKNKHPYYVCYEYKAGERMRSIKKLAFLDRFYKKFCCGAKNHPSGWKKQKRINTKTTRRRLKAGEEE